MCLGERDFCPGRQTTGHFSTGPKQHAYLNTSGPCGCVPPPVRRSLAAHRREWSCVNAPSWLTYRLGTLALALALAAGMSLAIRPEMRPLLRFCAAAV